MSLNETPRPEIVPERETDFPPLTYTWELNGSLSPAQRTEGREFLGKRDGGKCHFCTVPVTDIHIELEFHHTKGRKPPYLNRLAFLVLAHHSCNQREERARQSSLRLPTPERSEREKLGGAGIGDTAREISKEIDLNIEYEQPFRTYIAEMLLKGGNDPDETSIKYLSAKTLLNAACEWVGCSTKTGYPYLSKMTNPINGFIESGKKFGRNFLKFRYPDFYDKTPEEIAELRPKAGLVTRTGRKEN